MFTHNAFIEKMSFFGVNGVVHLFLQLPPTVKTMLV